MATTDLFEDFDQEPVYDRTQKRLLHPDARNFVVEFGQHEARIAWDLDFDNFEQLLKHEDQGRRAERQAKRPTRWMYVAFQDPNGDV